MVLPRRGLGRELRIAGARALRQRSAGPWTGEHAFSLADEAERTIALIDGHEGKVHLVGHSYGGGVALQAALARPDRIASMALYEPSAFHLLRQLGEPGAYALAEIGGVVRLVSQGVVTGDYRGAVAAFVDYWNGPGSWDALRPVVQSALIRWAPKAPLDFWALIENATSSLAYRALRFPVLMLRGEHAPTPTQVIAEGLSELLHTSRLMTVDGAGHMGPLTHAPEVSGLIVQFITAAVAEQRTRQRWWSRVSTDIEDAASQPAEMAS